MELFEPACGNGVEVDKPENRVGVVGLAVSRLVGAVIDLIRLIYMLLRLASQWGADCWIEV